MKINRETRNIEFTGDNGIIYKESMYEILDKKCLSSVYNAYIPGVIEGACECGNCKVKIRRHSYHKGAYNGDTSYHDFVYDVEEVLSVKDSILS